MSIGILLGTPRAAGLFHKAIIQSGGVKPVFAPHEYMHVQKRMLDAAGVSDIDALMDLSTDAFNAACQQVALDGNDPVFGGMPFHPAIDGIVLPAHPLDNLRRIPTLVGTCADEIGLFEVFDNKPLINGMPVRMRHYGGETWWQALNDTYQATTRGERWRSELLGDGFIGIPSLRLADALAAVGAVVWAYRFEYAGASEIGATHGADVAFTFNSPSAPPLPLDWNDTAQRLADRMQDAFIAFARSGSPQTAALPEWPVYTPDKLEFMVFDAECRIGRDPVGAERRAAWASLPAVAI
jgi:para-nitrobenzyl esterase